MIDHHGKVQFANDLAKEKLFIIDHTTACMGRLTDSTDKYFYKSENPGKTIIQIKEKRFVATHYPIYQERSFYGVSCFLEEEEAYVGVADRNDQEIGEDLKALFDNTYDVIYVSDHNGVTLRVSSACKELWGKEEHELIGRKVFDFENEGVFTPSITRLVLEKKEVVSVVQTTQTGKKLKVIGTPIKDQNGNIIRVVNVSKDITELSELQTELSEMRALVDQYKAELDELRKRESDKKTLVSYSLEMERVLTTASRVARVDSPVLIQGETGVGKELIADHIHAFSPRSEKPFIKLNCGAIPKELLESELFGYEKGAFSGAVQQKKGMFELANGGTLFLDEIGELYLPLQAKLLRVIQERELRRVGGTKAISLDVRIVAATNRDLGQMVNEGTFREDLYYRLNVLPLKVPALRNRMDDLAGLVLHFLEKFNHKYAESKKLSPNALNVLQGYHWPGNVRELRNVMERLVILTEGDVIDQATIEDYLFNERSRPSEKVVVNHIIPLKECVEEAERQLLSMVKKEYTSTSQMADVLKVNQSTISRKLQRLNLK
ncbi:sigma-54 interaction domain-containing protein (plasmid) [Rossellomorea sp. FS2]